MAIGTMARSPQATRYSLPKSTVGPSFVPEPSAPTGGVESSWIKEGERSAADLARIARKKAARAPATAAAAPTAAPTAGVSTTGGGISGGVGGAKVVVPEPSMVGLQEAVSGGSGGGDMGGGGVEMLAGPSRFRQGIGSRIPPQMSASLAALRQVY